MTPVYTVTVTSRVVGQIVSVNYQEGQIVHKGDSLLEIDPRPYQAALTQVQGQLAHDQAVLNEARIDLDSVQSKHLRGMPLPNNNSTTSSKSCRKMRARWKTTKAKSRTPS